MLTWHDGTAARTLLHHNPATLDGGTAGSASAPTARVSNNRLVVFLDSVAGTTNCGFLYVDGSNNLILGAGNNSRLQIASAGTIAVQGNNAFVPAAVSGTPAQHGLFRENVVKAWVYCDYAGAISDSFNVASITDNGTGDTTVTWDRDFASGDYAAVASIVQGVGTGNLVYHNTNSTHLAGSSRWTTINTTTGSAADAGLLQVIAIGDQ